MEVCKHKQTGKYFVYIHDTVGNEALLVTPLAQIKLLNLSQFSKVEEKDDDYLISNRLIEPDQAHIFREYQKSRSEENIENLKDLFDEMPAYQKKEFLELIKT